MKATLTISSRGLLALPAKMREAAGLRPQDNLIAETTPERILLRPAVFVPMSPGVASIAYGMPKGLMAALSDPSIPPDGHVLMMLAGFQIANSDVLKLSDYFTPLGVEIIETSWNI